MDTELREPTSLFEPAPQFGSTLKEGMILFGLTLGVGAAVEVAYRIGFKTGRAFKPSAPSVDALPADDVDESPAKVED